uniref:Transposase n=1 Tax=Steinernema glaseri TaxID=37863 RepID=A0A1I7Z599_9BILA
MELIRELLLGNAQVCKSNAYFRSQRRKHAAETGNHVFAAGPITFKKVVEAESPIHDVPVKQLIISSVSRLPDKRADKDWRSFCQ